MQNKLFFLLTTIITPVIIHSMEETQKEVPSLQTYITRNVIPFQNHQSENTVKQCHLCKQTKFEAARLSKKQGFLCGICVKQEQKSFLQLNAETKNHSPRLPFAIAYQKLGRLPISIPSDLDTLEKQIQTAAEKEHFFEACNPKQKALLERIYSARNSDQSVSLNTQDEETFKSLDLALQNLFEQNIIVSNSLITLALRLVNYLWQ